MSSFLIRNLASFSVRQLFDGPTRRWMSFPRFSLVDAFNCPPNMCRTLNPLDQLHKKWILRNVLKTSLVYCSLNSASPYTSKYLNSGGSIQNNNTDAKCEIFYRRTNALKPVSSFTTKNMRHIRHPPKM